MNNLFKKLKKQNVVVFVKAKCFFDGLYRLGIMLPSRPNGECSMKCLEFNPVLGRLDWTVFQIYLNSIIVLRKRIDKQFQLF